MGRLRLRNRSRIVAAALAALWPTLDAGAASGDDESQIPRLATRALIERHEAQAQGVAIEFGAALGRKLTQLPPRYGSTAALFDLNMATPLLLAHHLAAFNDRLAVPRPPSWLAHVYAATAQWQRQYGNATCAIAGDERSLLPNTLPQARDEIVRLAAVVQRRQRQVADRRARMRLATTYAEATDRLSAGFAASLPAAERRYLRRFFARLHDVDAVHAVCAAEIWMQLLQPAWLTRLRDLMNAQCRRWGSVDRAHDDAVRRDRYRRSPKRTLHVEDVLFLADLGGDDFLRHQDSADFRGEPQLIVDFAGNDSYQSSRPAGYAAGIGRTAILVDMAGDDTYGGNAHTQGSAVLGVGLLVDLGGNDSYRANSFGQGAALFGVGLLLDEGGADDYRVRANGQGLGMTEGLGMLVEYRGDDAYAAVSGPPTNYGTPGPTDAWAQGVARGVRGIAPGGIGVLVDYQGADRYDAGSFAQGGAYYRGVGQLLDLGHEDDDLLGSRYNAGWGAHGGVGYHFNEAGDDRYRTRHMVGAGIAWDASLALFVDGDGDDFYHFGGLSLGGAAHHSASWFVDGGGADHYVEIGPLAQADIEPPNLALFVDLGDDENRLNGRPAPVACEQRHDKLGIALWGAGASAKRCDDAMSPSP